MFLVHLLSTVRIIVDLLRRQSSAISVRANSVVSLRLDLLVLSVGEIRLGTEHPRDTDEGGEKENDLDESLAGVELVFREDLHSTRQCELG